MDGIFNRKNRADAEEPLPERYEFVETPAETPIRPGVFDAMELKKGAKVAGEVADTTIGANVKIEGNLKNAGSIEVNGEVEGEISSEQDVVIGQTAKIRGPIHARNVTIAGEVHGQIEAREKLEIMPSGQVNGDITMQLLVIQQGATFIGQSAMAGPQTSAPVTAEAAPHRRARSEEALTALLGDSENTEDETEDEGDETLT